MSGFTVSVSKITLIYNIQNQRAIKCGVKCIRMLSLMAGFIECFIRLPNTKTCILSVFIRCRMALRLFIADCNIPFHKSSTYACIHRETKTHSQGSSRAHSIFYGTLVNIHEQGLFVHTCYWSIRLPGAASKASVNRLFPAVNAILFCGVINKCSALNLLGMLRTA